MRVKVRIKVSFGRDVKSDTVREPFEPLALFLKRDLRGNMQKTSRGGSVRLISVSVTKIVLAENYGEHC